MSCPVCKKPTDKRTCSASCSGKLAYSWRMVNQVKKIMDSSVKQDIRKILWNIVVKNCKNNKKITCVDLWGGGGFSDYVLSQATCVKNQGAIVLYEIDNNPLFSSALRNYAHRMNHVKIVKNHDIIVHPICDSLTNFVQINGVKNQMRSDLIWLDYCGNINKEEELDIALCKNILKDTGILAITTLRAREKAVYVPAQRDEWVTYNIKKVFPDFQLAKTISYQNGHMPMATYIFKKLYKNLMRGVSDAEFLEQTGLGKIFA